MLNQKQIKLRNLAASEKFDTITYNFCIKNGLFDLDKIMQYYLLNDNFLKLKRSNPTSNQKLISICEKYNSIQHFSESISNSKLETIEENSFINYEFKLDQSKIDLKVVGNNIRNTNNSLDKIDENVELNETVNGVQAEVSNFNLDELVQVTENGATIEEKSNNIPNYSLYELEKIEGLSVRTITICENYELTNLEKILNFYFFEKENFKHLRNCGRKSVEELVILCEKYRKSVISSLDIHTIRSKIKILSDVDYRECFTSDILDTTFYELEKNENLSVRSQNICRDNGMTDLPSIITYYWANENFLKLKNCGQKANLELIEICRKYEIRIKKPSNVVLHDKTLNPLILKIDSLTVKQKQIINNLLVSKFNELPIRPQNALNALLENEITLKKFTDIIFSDSEFSIDNIRNVGALSEIQISTFLEVIKEQIELVSSCQDEREIEIKLCETFLIKNFSLNDTIIFKIVEDYDFSNGLPIFKIIKSLVDNDILFEIREKQIFYNEFCKLNEKDFKTINELSLDLEVSKERVRQIRVQFLKKFDSRFIFITQHEIKSLVNYNLDLSAYLIDISDDLIGFINNSEKVPFNRLFITRILAILYAHKFELIGSLSQNLHGRDYSTDKWKKSYLIDKKITAIFNFEIFYDDVKNRLSDRIEEDYNFNFQTYLLNFIRTSKYEMLDIILEIAEYILFNEFELCLDTNDSIIFKKNTKRQVIDYVYEVLEEKNIPLTIYEIYDIIEKKYSGVTKSAEALRGSCQGEPNLIFFGRTSTYALKIWEDKLNIKGGTIREIAEEYLQSQTEPKHIDEITKYVNIYRNTNSKSVFNNLNVDERKRFVFFYGQLIGLSSKKYSSEKWVESNSPNIERKTWEEKFFELNKFAKENNRLPCTNDNDSEIILYRFFKSQLNKANKGQIDDQKISKIYELVTRYNYKKGGRQLSEKWNNSYSELREFVMTNKRLPKVSFEDEKLLYYFFYNQRKLYHEDNLPLKFVESLLEITNLFNQHK